MNNLYKIAVITLLLILCILFAYTAYRANRNMLKVCPTNAITMQNGVAVIDSLRCIGCGRCALGIPSPYNLTLFPAIKPQSDSTSSLENSSVSEQNKPELIKTNVVNKPVKPITDSVKTVKKDNLVTQVKKLLYIVNPDICIGCTLCTKACPVNAITMINGKAVIDTEKCIEDDICISGNGTDYAGCPVSAISTQNRK